MFVFIFYYFKLFIFFNFNLLSKEQKEVLKVGLLAPLTGEFKELGNSLLYSLQLALDEIDDRNVFIIPKDSGFENKKKLNSAIKEFRSEGINIIIGPISYGDFGEVQKYKSEEIEISFYRDNSYKTLKVKINQKSEIGYF